MSSPGWYPDPAGSGRQRYFDGTNWTEHFHAPPPPPAAKKGGDTLKALLITAAVIVVALFIFGAISGGRDDTKPPAGSIAAPTQQLPGRPPAGGEGNNSSTPSGLHQAVRDGKFEFTVTGVYPISGYTTVHMTVVNIGDRPQSFFPGNQKLIDTAGREYAADTMAVYQFNDRGMVLDLNPGMSLKSIVPFQVPPGVQIAEVRVHDSAFSGGATVKVS